MHVHDTTTSILNRNYRIDLWLSLYSLIMFAIDDMPKCLMFRLTLTHPENISYTLDNMRITRFMDSFRHSMGRYKVKLLYFWAKEFSKLSYVGNFHYHVWVVLNGQDVRNPFTLRHRVQHLWGLSLGDCTKAYGHIDAMNVPGSYTRHGIMVRKSSHDFNYLMWHVWDQAQYLAKKESKIHYPFKGDAYGGSQVPQRSKAEALLKLFEIMPGR